MPISSPLCLRVFVVSERQLKYCSKFDTFSSLQLRAVVHLGSSTSYRMLLINDNQAFSPFFKQKLSLIIEGFKHIRYRFKRSKITNSRQVISFIHIRLKTKSLEPTFGDKARRLPKRWHGLVFDVAKPMFKSACERVKEVLIKKMECRRFQMLDSCQNNYS